jgi:hypothetical protein
LIKTPIFHQTRPENTSFLQKIKIKTSFVFKNVFKNTLFYPAIFLKIMNVRKFLLLVKQKDDALYFSRDHVFISLFPILMCPHGLSVLSAPAAIQTYVFCVPWLCRSLLFYILIFTIYLIYLPRARRLCVFSPKCLVYIYKNLNQLTSRYAGYLAHPKAMRIYLKVYACNYT